LREASEAAKSQKRRFQQGRRVQHRSGERVGSRRKLKAIEGGILRAPGNTIGPKSVSSHKSWSASARTIFGRAFQGAKRVIVDAQPVRISSNRTNDPSSDKAEHTEAFAGASTDVTNSADAEPSEPMQSATTVERMANIPLPHEEPTGRYQAGLSLINTKPHYTGYLARRTRSSESFRYLIMRTRARARPSNRKLMFGFRLE
jgi:hypothetical protein